MPSKGREHRHPVCNNQSATVLRIGAHGLYSIGIATVIGGLIEHGRLELCPVFASQ